MEVNEKEKIFHKHIKKHKRRKKIVKKEELKISILLTDCRQSPGICRDFYYEHCFSGIIEL